MQRHGIPLLLAAALLSCGEKDNDGDGTETGQVGEDSAPEGDADTDADADTDTDTDADADSDADSDADTDTDTDTDVQVEECGDGVDNDDDGLADCDDADCAASCPEVDCYDLTDNDLDGSPDCLDTDCASLCVEQCRDEFDNDQDGKTDCEDDDCMDVCLEDCSDGVDNDGDGAADCDDDECVGDSNCPMLYELSAQMDLEFVYMAAGTSVEHTAGYRAITQFYGTITVSGLPLGLGSAFTCTGNLRASSPLLGYAGVYYGYAGGCADCEYAFAFEPTVANRGIRWSGSCPVDQLPPMYMGLGRQDYDIARYYGGWFDAYTAALLYSSSSSSAGYGFWLYAPPNGTLEWSGYY